MKISEPELKKMIKEAVKKKMATLKESSDFTAKRKIIHSAQNASMEFEGEIKSLLNLVEPDDLPPNMQTKYLEIAEEMKKEVVQAVANAVRRFATMPRKDSGEGKGNVR